MDALTGVSGHLKKYKLTRVRWNLPGKKEWSNSVENIKQKVRWVTGFLGLGC